MITTIALDNGLVLAYPASGNWFLPANLPQLLGMRNMMKMVSGAQSIKENSQRAMDYLTENHLVRTVDEEFAQFKEFYKIMFGGCDMKGLDGIAEELARNAVFNEDKIKFYDDVLQGLRALKARWRVVVISDAWPSLRDRLDGAGITPLLDDVVVSCDYGHCKSSEGKLFQSAIEHHGILPEETLFVDDGADNLACARALGFHVAQMDREGKLEESDYPLVHTLEEVAALADAI